MNAPNTVPIIKSSKPYHLVAITIAPVAAEHKGQCASTTFGIKTVVTKTTKAIKYNLEMLHASNYPINN